MRCINGRRSLGTGRQTKWSSRSMTAVVLLLLLRVSVHVSCLELTLEASVFAGLAVWTGSEPRCAVGTAGHS